MMLFKKNNKKRLNDLDPKAERRRKLQMERRKEDLVELGRVFFFSSVSGVLGFLFLANAWSPISMDEIYVKGSKTLTAKSIVNASGISFPQPLMAISPKKLEGKLLQELPIKALSIRRRLFPPSLEVELLDKRPIAFANRIGPKGQEKGMLDEHGHWMPLRVAYQAEQPKKTLYVEGWMDSHQRWISIILKHRNNLGSPLKRIIISPNGELSIETKEFEMVSLGSNTSQLYKQIKVLAHLSKSLPKSFRNQVGTKIDMRDPSKPELQISRL